MGKRKENLIRRFESISKKSQGSLSVSYLSGIYAHKGEKGIFDIEAEVRKANRVIMGKRRQTWERTDNM